MSKKLIAFLVAEVTWKILLALYLKDLTGPTVVVALTLIIVVGFIETAYILGQAALDRYLTMVDRLPPHEMLKKEKDLDK